MKSAAALLADRKPQARPAPHSKAAAVNEIIAFLGDANKASYPLWLSRIGKASYGDVMAILKRAKDLPVKYNRAGYITNQLKIGGLSASRPLSLAGSDCEAAPDGHASRTRHKK